MGIDEKPAAQWTETDLDEVCHERRLETARLEFKQELALDTESQKKEAEKDVHGLANAGGGHIIYGIAERDAGDGMKAADSIVPISDGSLYERLNNVLDSRGEPKVPFDIHPIRLAAGDWVIVIEVFGHRRPHRSSNGKYHVRRNVLVREMSEPEIAEAYQERFIRDAARLAIGEAPELDESVSTDINSYNETIGRSVALYRAETNSGVDPPWLAVEIVPVDAATPLFDPLETTEEMFYEASRTLEERWRPEESPLEHYRLHRTVRGFLGQLPDRDDTYPRYFVGFWRSGLAVLRDLLEPQFPGEPGPYVIPSAAVTEYTHDFIALAYNLYAARDYTGRVEVTARLENVNGMTVGVRPMTFVRVHPVTETTIQTKWNGAATQMLWAAGKVAHDISNLMFIDAGAERSPLFQGDVYSGRG